MNSKTSLAEFDFPLRAEEPHLRYLICSTPRSGSNMLVRGLWLTKIAGAPEEFFAKPYLHDYCSRFEVTSANLSSFTALERKDETGRVPLEGLLRSIMSVRTSTNGVFGMKLHANHFFHDHLRLVDLKECIRPDKIIYIRRADRVRQAISLLFARHTGKWIDDPDWQSERPTEPPSTGPVYDHGIIEDACEYIDTLNVFLEHELNTWDIPVIEVWYEELCAKYATEMRKVLDFLDITIEVECPLPNIRKQEDPLKEDWWLRSTESGTGS